MCCVGEVLSGNCDCVARICVRAGHVYFAEATWPYCTAGRCLDYSFTIVSMGEFQTGKQFRLNLLLVHGSVVDLSSVPL